MRCLTTLAVLSLVLLTAAAGVAQIRVERLSLVDTSKAELYIGCPNRIRVVGLQPLDTVFLGSEPVNMRIADEVIVQPRLQDGPTETFSVIRNGKPVFAQSYRVLRLPDPKLFLGNVSLYDRKTVTTQELNAARELCYRTGNFRSAVSVDSFELGVLCGGEYTTLGKTAGAQFSRLQQTRLAELQPGDRIYIENIRGTFIADHKQRWMVSAAFVVAE